MRFRQRLAWFLTLAATVALVSTGQAFAAGGLVVSQVYGGGGNATSVYTNDFVELFNPTAAAISVTGWSVQYASSAGTTWQSTALTGSVDPGRYYLVRESQGAGGTTPLPTPEASGTIAMSATAGKVALSSSTTLLTGSCPTGLVDLVGFGGANCFEGTAPTAVLSNSTAAFRADGGCTDTNNNAADFSVAAAAPRNGATAAHTCGGPPPNQPVSVDCTQSLSTTAGTPGSTTVTATDPDGTVTDIHVVSVTPSPGPGTISRTAFTPAAAAGGTATATIATDAQVPAGSYTVQIQAANGDATPQTATCSLSVSVAGIVTIGAVQGSVPDGANGTTFVSPLNGQTVTVQGVVTDLTLEGGNHGFFLQSTPATADADPLSSDGIFVFQSHFVDLIGGYVPAVGDEIVIRGKVNEFFDQTELGSATLVQLVRHGAAIAPFVAAPPADAAEAARYWERREGMLATVATESIVDSPRHFYSSTGDTEFYAIATDAPVAGRADPFGRRVFRDAHPLDDLPGLFDDGNGYRILVTDEGIKATAGTELVELPPVHTFQTFTSPATGGVYFDFGKYSVSVAQQPQTGGGSDPATNDPPPVYDRSVAFSIANSNFENLYDYRDDPFDGCDFDGNPGCPGVTPPFDYTPASDAEYQGRLTEIAHQIVDDLHSPDVISFAEAEDQDICTVSAWQLVCGTTNNADGKPDTVQELATRIHALGGPDYDAAFDRDGADTRGIVSGFLYRTDSAQLLPAAADDPVLGSSPAVQYRSAALPYNTQVSNPKALNAVLPADVDRSTGVDGTNVFTRAAQVAHFRLTVPGSSASSDVWVIANHFTSGPDSNVGQRREQAAYDAAIATAIKSGDPAAKIDVAGDLNDYPRPDDPFPPPGTSDQLAPLYDAGLTNLYDSILAADPAAAYSYVFEGQAQDLDHQFVSSSLFGALRGANEAHINSDWSPDTPGDNRGTSDHDPMVARYSIETDPPVTTASLAATPIGAWFTARIVTLTGSDGAAGTGVASTEYAVDGGPWTVYKGPFRYGTDSKGGPHTVAFRSTDRAGNVEATNTVSWTETATAPEQLDGLDAFVAGLHLGPSLTGGLRGFLSDTKKKLGKPNGDECHPLGLFVTQVMQQAGSGLTFDQAADLLSANQIEILLGCIVADSPRPAGEEGLVQLGRAIAALPDASVAGDLGARAGKAGKQVSAGQLDQACATLADLGARIDTYVAKHRLTPAQAGQLRALVAPIAGAIGC